MANMVVLAPTLRRIRYCPRARIVLPKKPGNSVIYTGRGGLSSYDETLSGYEDDDLFLRLFRAGYDNVYLDQRLSRWRVHGDSASFTRRMSVSRMRFARKLVEAYPDD